MTYIPQDGDRIRRDGWPHTSYVDVIAYADGVVFGRDRGGVSIWRNAPAVPWVKVEPRPDLPDLPDRWVAIYAEIGASSLLYPTAEAVFEINRQTRAYSDRHPEVIAAVRYVAGPESVVWADEVDEKETP